MRLLSAIPILFIVSIGVFAVTHIMPGDPVQALFGNDAILTPEVYAKLRTEYGLDQPLPVQYGKWLGHLAQGDLGTSIQTRRPVTEMIATHLPTTLQLSVLAWLLGIAVAIPAGVLAAVHRNSWIDRSLTAGALSGVAIPDFWMGLMFILIFGVWFKLLPPSGFVNLWDEPLEGIQHLILPALTLGLHLTGTLTRQTRSSMLDVLNQDYVRTARAKGLKERHVRTRHALRNAMLPILTVLGVQAGALIGGTVVIETVFAIPGIGRLAVNSVLSQDLPVIQGIVIVIALAVVLANLVTDITYSLLDPRVRYD